MKLYYQEEDYTLYEGNMLDMLEVIKPNSIDSIVCDPPYELNFMNKGWDSSGIAFQKEAWEKCFKVLKSGGYLLAFGGSRTFHRIACAIEDAGFEIRDTIMYLYGCLSNDTQILTSNGWKNSETIKINDEIYSLDLEKNILIKNKVKNIFKYDYDGEMVNLKNANTNQLLTPNHHCIVKDTIKTKFKGQTTHYTKHDYWCYKDAWQLRSQPQELPLASNYNGTLEIGNLFAELLGWVISEGTYNKDTNAITITQSSVNKSNVSRIRYILGKLHIKYSEYSRVRKYKDREYTEYDFYIGKEAVDLVNKIKELAPNKKLTYKLLELSLSNKEFLLKGLCGGDGAKSTSSKFGFSAFYQKDVEQLEIFQTLLHLTNKQGWLNINKHSCSIHSNPNTELQGKYNKNRFVKYDGKYVWCIETEIGNFVAKREGKIFITGNSGFPKSMNIGLAIDKRNGIDNRTGVIRNDGASNGKHFNLVEDKTMERVFAERQAQNEWAGWGTQLKPAYEPIIVARKPIEKTIVDNVLKYGVGGINIDECRVGDEHFEITGGEYDNNPNQSCFGNVKRTPKEYDGRFPANVIHDGSEEATSGMPDTKGVISNRGGATNTKENVYGSFLKDNTYNGYACGYDDEGSASRYFYCAKASKKDRDDGLIAFEEKQTTDGCIRTNIETARKFGANSALRKNTHPTVKPIELMQYLVRLVSPKGATILDCFMGSGSTGKAVMFENRERNANYKFIGIELTEEYLPICRARIDYGKNKYEYDIKQEQIEDMQDKGYSQISLFDI